MQAAKYRQLPRSSRASVRPLELFFFCFRGFASLSYDDIFALRGWKKEEINGIVFELNSILVEKWKGKPYRLYPFSITHRRPLFQRVTPII